MNMVVYRPSGARGPRGKAKDTRTDVQTVDRMALSALEVAQALGISRNAGYNLMHTQGFPSFRIGGRWLVHKAAFQQWLDAQI